MIVLMTCLDVMINDTELCRKRHKKKKKNAGITSKKLKNGANYLNINVVTVTKRKSVKRKEKRDMKKKNDALDMENKRLQEQKAEAEQELKRAKK